MVRYLVRLHVAVPVQHAVTVATVVEILRPFDFGDQWRGLCRRHPAHMPPLIAASGWSLLATFSLV